MIGCHLFRVTRPDWVGAMNGVIQIRVHLGVPRSGWDNFLKRRTYQQYYLFANIYYAEFIMHLKMSLGVLQL